MPTTPTNFASQIFSNPAYFGKHVVVVDDHVYVATTGDEAVRILEKIRQKHHGKQPILAYIPKDETLILALWR